MKAATLFPDDDIHDTADDWNDSSDAAPNESEQDAKPPRPPDPLDKPPKPYHNGTLTSRAAAEFVRPSVNSQIARVWGFIDSHGNHGATDKEIQAGLKMDGNSQRPRRVWLMRNGCS